jgi:hypothetical protein
MLMTDSLGPTIEEELNLQLLTREETFHLQGETWMEHQLWAAGRAYAEPLPQQVLRDLRNAIARHFRIYRAGGERVLPIDDPAE